MAVASSFARRIGAAVKRIGGGCSSWHGAYMAAAAAAISERIPLVDLVLEVRDARMPLSSAFNPSALFCSSSKHIIILNKMDLADRHPCQGWVGHFEMNNLVCIQVNSHNKESIKKLLNFVRSRIRQLKDGEDNYTATVLLVGIPNVGKSAIANLMHRIGRIGAEEKGKLKHAVVSPRPGETKDISGYKIGSHPNIYVFDTPGILSPEIIDEEVGSKLALIGAIKDSLVGEHELAGYFLSILNSSRCAKHWDMMKCSAGDVLNLESKEEVEQHDSSNKRAKKQYATDHTQDFIVRHVRQTLSSTLSSFEGNLKDENNMKMLIDVQFRALREAFRLQEESDEEGFRMVAIKLLNLFRIGRLGRYTFDLVPTDIKEPS